LFRLAPDPYLVTDLHGVIIEANRRARVLLNTERPEGTTLTTYVASEAGLLHWMRDTARGGRTAARDVTLAPRDGPALIVRASVVRGAAVDATPVLRWVLHDVTDARRSQRALQAAFAEAHEEVAHMRDVDEWKNVMLTAAAHDLHSPLSAILVAAKTALERPDLDTVTRRTLLEDVRGHARRAQTLLSNLLDLDRLTRGVVRAEREPCRLDVLVTDAVDAAAVTDHPVTTDARRVEAMVDPTQLRQMVTNLVVNAAQHTPAGTPVHVAAWADGETVRITVDDEGPGLPGDLRDVFAPFVTAPRHSNDAAGTGIGLSLVKLFADLHDGVVHAENRPKGGARFTIELRGCVLSSGVR
jgi:signal transduction histidine kinase